MQYSSAKKLQIHTSRKGYFLELGIDQVRRKMRCAQANPARLKRNQLKFSNTRYSERFLGRDVADRFYDEF